MTQNKNHWIAIYLTGKYPGMFYTPDKLLFLDTLQNLNPKTFSDERIKMFGIFGSIDEHEFYYSFLNKVERDFPDEFRPFLDKLLVPRSLFNLTDQFQHIDLLKKFREIRGNQDKVAKGKCFEDFLKELFESMEGLKIVETKLSDDEQTDIVIKNNVNKPFWINLNSPLLIGEAKNWNDKTNTATLNTLVGKLDDHINFSKVAFVVAMNGFTKPVETSQKRKAASGKIVFTITGDEIEAMLESTKDPILWLEDMILSAFI